MLAIDRLRLIFATNCKFTAKSCFFVRRSVSCNSARCYLRHARLELAESSRLRARCVADADLQ